MADVTFWVDGDPVAQGSMIAMRAGKKVYVVPSNKASLAPWRDKVAKAAYDARESHGINYLLDGPLSVEMWFYFERPKSKPNWKIYHDVKIDADKAARAVNDSLTNTIIVDDARIVDLSVHKRYALDTPPGVQVKVYTVDEPQEPRLPTWTRESENSEFDRITE